MLPMTSSHFELPVLAARAMSNARVWVRIDEVEPVDSR